MHWRSFQCIILSAAQRIVPTQWQVRAFNRPTHELSLAHVRSESGHDAHVRRMLYEGMQRGFILPSGERPESLGQRTREDRIADNAVCRCQLLNHLSCIEEETGNPPVTFQGEIGQQSDILSLRFRGPKCSPRARWHDSGILSHRFSRHDVRRRRKLGHCVAVAC